MPEPSSDPPLPRPAARVVLLDARDRILLFKFTSEGRSWWVTPGGGVDPGETHRQAALRELREETGLTGVRLSRAIWLREHAFHWLGRHLLQQERFFVARVPAWEVDRTRHTEEEREVITEHRWWGLAEIAASNESFAPRELARHLALVLAGTLPRRPLRLD